MTCLNPWEAEQTAGPVSTGSSSGLLPVPKTLPSPVPTWKGATSAFQDTQRHPKATVLWGSGTWSPKALWPPVPGSWEANVPSPALPSHLEPGQSPASYVPGKRIWMKSGEPASKILPFKTKPNVLILSSLIIEFSVSHYQIPICGSSKGPSASQWLKVEL